MKKGTRGLLLVLTVTLGGFGGLMLGPYFVHKKIPQIEIYKKELSTYVDKDTNGLSLEEHYQIRGLAGVQDSSSNYEMTSEDWTKGYDSMLVEKRMKKEAFWEDLEEKGLVEVINSQKDLHKK